MNTQLRGKMLLKVVGIIYIVFSGFSILAGLLSLIGGGLFLAGGVGAGTGVSAGMGGVAMFLGVVLIAASALGLVTGILGVKYCNRADKAQTCFILGIVLLVFSVLNLLSSLVSGDGFGSSLVGLVLPGLYTYGAYLNKQQPTGGYDNGSYNGNTYGQGGGFSQGGNMGGQGGGFSQGGNMGGQNGGFSQGGNMGGQNGVEQGAGMNGNSGVAPDADMNWTGGQAQGSGISLKKPEEGDAAPFPDPTADPQTAADNGNKRTVYLGKDEQ